MSALKLGDELCVVVWQKGRGDGPPRGYPTSSDFRPVSKPIEVVNGEIGSVVQIQIRSIKPDRVVGCIKDGSIPSSDDWQQAQRILKTQYDFKIEVIKQNEGPRLMIRSRDDYAHQWLEQIKEVLDEISMND